MAHLGAHLRHEPRAHGVDGRLMRYASVNDLPPSMREQAERQLRDRRSVPTVRPGADAVEKLEAKCERGPSKLAKYRNQRVFLEGEWFDSKLEYDCFCWIRLRRAAGEVLWFLRQVPFVLEGGVRYRADFLAVLTAGGVEVWDAKGKDTRASINKRKQVKARYGVEVRLWTKADR